MHWQDELSVSELAPDEVHLWSVDLDNYVTGTPVLSSEESERACRFVQPIHRVRYAAAHTALRQLLSAYLRRAPESLSFESQSTGKPFIESGEGEERLFFNLSHSEDLALIGVTRAGEIGVDIERLRPVPDVDDIASRFFSESERQRIREMKSEDQARAFLICWTRKEAYIKARGTGLSTRLSSFEVEVREELPARLIQIDGDESTAASWTLLHVEPANDFVGAAAIEARAVRPRLFRWMS